VLAALAEKRVRALLLLCSTLLALLRSALLSSTLLLALPLSAFGSMSLKSAACVLWCCVVL
jgi:hypothetical protein